MTYTVKEFVSDSYQLVSANSPTVTLPNGDQMKAVCILNYLLESYSGTGLLTPIATQVNFVVPIATQYIIFYDPTVLLTPPLAPQPTPVTPVYVTGNGRLSNLQNSWLHLNGETYPLVDESRNVFFNSYKFDPQQGLPRFCIITNNDDYTTMRLYPSPSQQYDLTVYGKFQLSQLNINSNVSIIPQYMYLFLLYALAKQIAFFKGRASAWTPQLEVELVRLTDDLIATSPVNLTIRSDNDSLLNGSWRVRAGV